MAAHDGKRDAAYKRMTGDEHERVADSMDRAAGERAARVADAHHMLAAHLRGEGELTQEQYAEAMRTLRAHYERGER